MKKNQATICWGTSYFRSVIHAEFYYKPQFGAASREIVSEKLKNGEIHVGYPPLKEGETCHLIDNGCRWAVRTWR